MRKANFKETHVSSGDGGRLITSARPTQVSAASWVDKVDWRRVIGGELRTEGYDKFYPKTTESIGLQNFPGGSSPILFLGTLNRANGDKAFIAATATDIYRFIAYDNGEYFVGGDYHNTGYFESTSGDWMNIGSGFSPNTKRWEAVMINSNLVMNNSYDLPVIHRFEETRVKPIYELRDNGITRVGTIAELADSLICADIYQMNDDTSRAAVVEPLSFTGVTASQVISGYASSGTEKATIQGFFGVVGTAEKIMQKIIASSPPIAFTTNDANHKSIIIWDTDGKRDLVDGFVDGTTVTVVSDDTRASQPFTKLSRSTRMQSTEPAASSILAAGQIVRFENGIRATVVSVSGGTPEVATLDVEELVHPARAFTVQDDVASNFHVVASAGVFTSDMVGESILFDSGQERKIVALINSTTVQVNKDNPILASGFKITNPNHYAAVTDTKVEERIGYREIWSAIAAPSMFGATVTAAVTASSKTVILANPANWVGCGCAITITGAGVNGGNLTTKIDTASHGNTVLRIRDLPSTTVAEAVIQSTEQIGNIVGLDDLSHDGRAIVKMVKLDRTRLIVYKEQVDGECEIFIQTYTGDVDSPFFLDQVHKGPDGPLYPEAIIEVAGGYHVYPGRNAFYKFDAVTQHPVEIESFQHMEKTFFDDVDSSDRSRVFAADNTITKEIMFFYPSNSGIDCLRFDYRHGTISRSQISARSAAMIRRPNSEEEWFVMGLEDGTIIRNGVIDADVIPIPSASQSGTTVTSTTAVFTSEHVGRSVKFADGTLHAIIGFTSATVVEVDTSATVAAATATIIPAIWHHDGADYTSTIQSGVDHWGGNGFNEILLERIQPQFGEFVKDASATYILVGAMTQEQEPEDVKAIALTDLSRVSRTANLVRKFWGDKTIITGKNNPATIVRRSFRTKVIGTKGWR